MRTDHLALQLYTVREQMAAGAVDTLRAVAEVGYPAVELAGYAGLPVAELRVTLDELGLRAMGAHVPFPRLIEEFPIVAAELQTLGCAFAVAPSVPREHLADAESVRKLAETFNDIGERCQAAGLRFAYHNHDWEFAPLPGVVESASGATPTNAYEVLLIRTDPALVSFELDVFWAEVAGYSGVRLLKAHRGRFPLVHLKDMEDTPDKADAPVGTGILEWPPVLEAAGIHGDSDVWLIVEQDHPKDALNDIATSLRNLRALLEVT